MEVDLLQNLVKKYLCEHFHKIDSLKNIPEVIGKDLANFLSDYLSNSPANELNSKIVKCVMLFTDAYGHEVLNALNLSNSALLERHSSGVVHERLYQDGREAVYQILNMKTITRLDLSNCHCVTHLTWLSAIGQMTLETLSLREIELKDDDIAQLTICARIKKRGLMTLRELDISGNPVTHRCLCRLKSLINLEKVIVSRSPVFKEHLVDSKVWQLMTSDLSVITVDNAGWLAELISSLALRESRKSSFYKKKPIEGHGMSSLVLTRVSKENTTLNDTKHSLSSADRLSRSAAIDDEILNYYI